MRNNFRRGEVVFVKSEGEYMKMRRRVSTNVYVLFNPRWGGEEMHFRKEFRPLTNVEMGHAAREG